MIWFSGPDLGAGHVSVIQLWDYGIVEIVGRSTSTRCSPPFLVCCQRRSEPLVGRWGCNRMRAEGSLRTQHAP